MSDEGVTIKIPTHYLAALMLFAGQKDIRYYLNGIYVETVPEGAILTATNGHMIGAFLVEQDDLDVASAIVPNEMIAALLAIKPKGDATLTILADGALSLRYEDTTFGGRAINGKYPEWRRVMPSATPSGECAQFNPRYITAIAKACKLIDQAWPTLAHNGKGPALIGLGDPNFVGALMPMSEDPMLIVPSWAKPVGEPEQEPATEPA